MQRVLVVGRPARHHDRVDAERRDREQVEHARRRGRRSGAGCRRPQPVGSHPRRRATTATDRKRGQDGHAPARPRRSTCWRPRGITSSLKKSLIPSATGCSRPKGPVRFGPEAELHERQHAAARCRSSARRASAARWKMIRHLDGADGELLLHRAQAHVAAAAAPRRAPAFASASSKVFATVRQQRFSRTWYSYSSRNFVSVDMRRRGRGVAERAHRLARDGVADGRRGSRGRAPCPGLPRSCPAGAAASPCPRGRASTCRRTRACRSRRACCATQTMQVESSMTMVPAEPSIEPALTMLSKSMFTSISVGGQHRRRRPARDHAAELARRRACPARSSRRRRARAA